MKKILSIIFTTATAIFSFAAANDVILENDFTKITLAADKGFRPCSIYNKLTDCNIPLIDDGEKGLWSIQLYANGKNITIVPEGEPAVECDGSSASFFWQQIYNGNNIFVTANVTLPEDSGIAEWSISAECSGNNIPMVHAIDYPCLPGIGSIGDDSLIIPLLFGKILKNPANQEFSPWPTYPGWWGQQFFAFSGSPQRQGQSYAATGNRYTDGFFRGADQRETGLYFSADDPKGMRKNMLLNGVKGRGYFTAGMRHFPQWPDEWREGTDSCTFVIPYKILMGTFCGGNDTAIDIYKNQVRDYYFLQNGPLKGENSNGNMSARIMQNPVFSNNWTNSATIPVREQRLSEFYGVPVIMHHYSYGMNYFDYSYPDVLPAGPYYRQANRILRKRGTGIMPYTNSVRADLRSRNFALRDLITDAAVTIDDTLLASPMEGNPFVCMSGGNAWTDMHKRLLSYFIGGQEASGYYLDEGGQSNHMLYNQDSPQHGSNEWTRRFHNMVSVLRQTASACTDAPFFSTECFNEHYIGIIDSFLLYSLLGAGGGWYVDLNFDHYPIFSRTYHEYTSGHSVPLYPHTEATTGHLACALNFVWGLSMHAMDPDKAENMTLPLALYSRELVQASYQAGSDYLLGGRMLTTALIKTESDMGTAPAAVVSEEKNVDSWPNWRGPALMASTWESLVDNSIGIVIAGSVSEECSGTLLINKDHEELQKCGSELWQLWPLPARKIADLEDGITRIPLTLAADTCKILSLRNNEPPAPLPLIEKTDRVLERNKETLEFPSWQTAADRLFAGEFFLARNTVSEGTNTVTPISKGSKADVEVVADWGLAGDLPFERIYPVNARIAGDAEAIVSGSGKCFFGTLKTTGEAEFITDTGFKTLFADSMGNVSETMPEEEVCRFLTAPAEYFTEIPDPEKIFSDIGNRYFSAAEKDLLAEAICFRNGQIFLQAGLLPPANLTNNWLLPGIPRSFENEFLVAIPETAAGAVKEDKTIVITENDMGAVLPVLFMADTPYGKQYLLEDMECADPLWMDIPALSRMKDIDSDGKYNIQLRFRNRSVEPLTVELGSELPVGWQCISPWPSRFVIPAESEIYYPVSILPADGNFIQERITFYAEYGQETSSRAFASFMACGKEIPLAVPTGETANADESVYFEAFSNASVICRTNANGEISFSLTRDATGYSIYGQNGEVIAEENFSAPTVITKTLQMPSPGIYRAEFRSAWILGISMTRGSLLGFNAGLKTPVEFYSPEGEFYIRPFQDAEYFEYSTGTSLTGGAIVEVYDPAGSRAFPQERIFSHVAGFGCVFRVYVPEEFRNEPWKLKTVSAGRLQIHAGAAPWLAVSPENALAAGNTDAAAAENANTAVGSGNFVLPDYMKLQAQNRYLSSFENILSLEPGEPLTGSYVLTFDCATDTQASDNRFCLYVCYPGAGEDEQLIITTSQEYTRILNNGEKFSYSVPLKFEYPVTQATVVVHTGRSGKFFFDNFELKKD